MDSTDYLRTYAVRLAGPLGEGVIEVPTTLGAEAAGRRATAFAMSIGWGDFDSLTVTETTDVTA